MRRARRAVGFGVRLAVLGWVGWLAASGVAAAQQQGPRVGPFAVDVHGVMATFGPTEEQAAVLGYAKGDLPSLGLGLDVGAHWYPLRMGPVTLGVGGNFLIARGSSNPKDELGEPTGNTADTRIQAMASQVSLNFAGEGGWSYISGGIGVTTFTIANDAFPAPASPERRTTINFGGGARWFLRNHVAFSLDLRFYRIPAATSVSEVPDPAAAATMRVVLGAGVSFR